MHAPEGEIDPLWEGRGEIRLDRQQQHRQTAAERRPAAAREQESEGLEMNIDHWQSEIPPPTPTGNSIATQHVMDESRNSEGDGRSGMKGSRPNLAEMHPRAREKMLIMERHVEQRRE